MQRIIITRRQGTHRCKTRHRHRRDRAFRTAAYHRVGIATLDNTKTVTDRVGSSRACGRGGGVGAPSSMTDRHVAGGEIYDSGDNKERRDAIWTGIEELLMLPFYGPKIADAGTDIRPDHIGVRLVNNQ